MAKALTETHSPLLRTLASEAEVVRQFVELLKLEQSALSAGKTDDLPALADKKAGLAANLNQLAAQRNALLASQGFSADPDGVKSWCAKNTQDPKAIEAWSRILSLASEARELNRVNGELIQIRMQYNAKALEALQGGHSSLNLYGPDGQAKASGQKRIHDAV